MNRALADKMSTVPLLNEEDVKVLRGVEPVLTTFSDICDAAGQSKATISQWAVYLSRLWEVSAPTPGEPPLVAKYKTAIRDSLTQVRPFLALLGLVRWPLWQASFCASYIDLSPVTPQ